MGHREQKRPVKLAYWAIEQVHLHHGGLFWCRKMLSGSLQRDWPLESSQLVFCSRVLEMEMQHSSFAKKEIPCPNNQEG